MPYRLAVIHRRSLLLGAAALAGPAAAMPATGAPASNAMRGVPASNAMRGVPASGALAFKAFRNGSPFGSHRLRFTASGAAMTVDTHIEYAVSFGPIGLFSYTMTSTETWKNGVLMGFHSEVDDDGSRHVTHATRVGRSLVVDGAKTGTYRAPPGSIDSSHWDRHEMDAPMINSDTGKLMDFTVTRLGDDMITPASGPAVAARHYALRGPDTIDLWYDRQDVWASLRAVAKDKSVITYQRQ
jgi:hypothetical protein